MRTATKYPAFADGFIVIDSRHAPTLKNAIGCRIYRKRAAAVTFRDRCAYMSIDASYLQVVPVDGPNDVFALGYIDATDVTVNDGGHIRIERKT